MRFPRTMVRNAAAMLALGASVALAQTSGRKNGDVNNDGSVSSVDALAVLNAVAELPAATGNTPSWGDSNCDGKVTAVDAQIILAFTVSLDVAQFCVNKVPTATISVVSVDAGTGQVMVGGTLQLSATPRDSTNAAINGQTVTWTSSDAAKATVSASGLVTGVAVGDVTITATAGGRTGSAIVTVIAASTSKTLEVAPRTLTLLKDSTVTLTASVKDAAGNPVSGTIAWSAEKTTIVDVNASTGAVKGIALGTSKVYATSGTLKDSAFVTVTAAGATATKTWTGATSTDWGTAGNWNPSVIPAVTDTVYIPSAPANQPVLGAGTTIAGLVVQTGAKVTVGTYELQVTGRADVDGEVTGSGTGKVTMQGVSTRESYLRGKLPSVKIIGSTVITAPTTITGTLDVTPSSIFQVDRYTVNVSDSLSVRGALRMQSSTAKLIVKGSARFFNDASTTDAILTAGTLQVGGNFHLIVPGVAANPFPATGTHKTVFDGAARQVVRDTNIVVAQFQELEVANTAGGVEFDAADTLRYRVNGRMNVTTGTPISGKGRVNVLQTYTQAAGGSNALRNLAVGRGFTSGAGFRPDTLTLIGTQALPTGTAYEYQTVVAAAPTTLSGRTTTAGSVIVGCVTAFSDCGSSNGSVNVNGQKLLVAKDVRQGALGTGPLTMVTTGDSVVVSGSLLGPVGLTTGNTEFTVNDGEWTAGVLRVAGEFRGRGTGAKTSHITILDGPAQQSLRIIKGWSFQALTIADSAGVVMNDTTAQAQSLGGRRRTIAVKGDFNITTPVKLTGTGRLDVAGNVQTATGSSVEVGAISVGQTLQAAGAYIPDTAEFNNPGTAQTIQNLPNYNTVIVSGKATFGGSMTFKGSLIVRPGAELNVDGRHVTVTKSMMVSGILRMQSAADSLTVLGDSTVFYGRNDPSVKNYTTAGVLRTGGLLRIDSTGFYPTGTHKVLYVGRSGDARKTASGVFNHLEVAGVNTSLAASLNSVTVGGVVHGNFTATSGATRIRVDSSTVIDGNAEITQADTVTLYSPDTTRGVRIKGNLRLRNVTANYTRVTGNVTLVDGARPYGYLRYSGKYTEEGTVTSTGWRPGLLGVAYLRYVQQPTNTQTGAAFSPAVAIEVLDSSGKRITTGSALLIITGSGLPSGSGQPSGTEMRVITVDGVATLTGLKAGTAGTGFVLLAGTLLDKWLYNTFQSNAFDVTP